MGRPLSPAERQAIAAWLSRHRPTICPPCRRGPGSLPFWQPETPVEHMQAVWRAMKSRRQARQADRAAKTPAPDATVLVWYKMYSAAGMSLAAIGALVRRDPSTVRDAFRRHNLPTRPRGAHLAELNAARATTRRAA